MHGLVVAAALMSIFGHVVPIHAQQEQPSLSGQSEIARSFGALPRPGNLSDVLNCAGANEVFWIAAMQDDPRNPEAHEAKRKAGWYSAVALWVFEADSLAVIDAVKSASELERRTEVFQLARQCRKAPDNWRE